MPRKCTICNHIEVESINEAIINGEPLRNIAEHFDVATTSLHRHKEHLPAGMVQAKQAEEVTQADNLLAQVQDLQQRAVSLLDKAESAGDLKTALQGVREARGCLELLAKLQGELAQEGTVNVTFAPQWIELRAVILQAIEPFPEAKEALTEALQGVDGEC